MYCSPITCISIYPAKLELAIPFRDVSYQRI